MCCQNIGINFVWLKMGFDSAGINVLMYLIGNTLEEITLLKYYHISQGPMSWLKTLIDSPTRYNKCVEFHNILFNDWITFADILCLFRNHGPTELYMPCIRVLDVHSGYVASLQCWYLSDVIMSAIASKITVVTIVYSTVCSGIEQRKHQSSALLAFVWGIHRWPVNSPPKSASNKENVSISMTSSCNAHPSHHGLHRLI